jgi:multidrug efflux pump subunit AcrB
MIKFLVKRPVAVIMTFVAVVILGYVAMRLIPVSLLPDIDIPEITIQVSAPDKSAGEVEQNYIRPIRRQMLQLTHLDDIETIAGNEQGTIKLKFRYNTNINYAFVEVNEKMDGLMYNMPSGFERPRIIKASATDIPVFYLNVSLKNQYAGKNKERFMEISEFSEQIIKKRIEQLNGVAMVDISGLEYPEININASLDKLNALGIDYHTIQSALEENNLSMGNIKVRNGMYVFNVKYSTLLKNRRDIENTIIKAGGRIFLLKELTDVTVKPKIGRGIFTSSKNQSVVMAVIKKSDTRIEDLKTETQTLLASLNEDYPRLNFEVARNQTELLDYSISNLESSLLIGSMLAILIMLLFLKDLKSPLLIGISIPVSLIISLLFFFIFDISINILSLSGLILGVGMMIDNSIIVIDNITQHYKKGKKDVIKASVKGTREVVKPLISSVLTTCAVFIPLIFLSGITGALFYDQAMAVTIGLFSSLVVSITLIPVLYARLYNRQAEKKDKKPKRLNLKWLHAFNHIENSYDKGYDRVFRNKGWFLSGTLLLLITGCFAFIQLPKERFPSSEQKEAIINVNWNQNISVGNNHMRLASFVSMVDTITSQISCTIGPQSFMLESGANLSPEEAVIYFKTTSAEQCTNIIKTFERWIEKHYPDALFEYGKPESIFEKLFADNDAPFELQLWTNGAEPVPSPGLLNNIAASVYNKTGYKPSSDIPTQNYYEISPRFDRIKLYDVSLNQLTSILQKSFNKLNLFTIRQGQYEVPVILTGEQKDIHSILKTVRVPISNAGSIPIGHLVDLKNIRGYKYFYGGKDGIYASLNYNIPDNLLEQMQKDISEVMKSYPDIHVKYSGGLFSNRKIFTELMIILSISLLLLYFILAAQFNSIVQPLILFIEIPIDIAGALLVLWLSGNSLNIMSMIGLVVMTGIIINDSILKIDTINRLLRKGHPILEAIQKGGRRRLKPIIMTSATTILAMIPFLWGSDFGSRLQQPLAYTIIGGMAIGTFVSLYFIPLAYYYLMRNKKQAKRA